MSSIFKLMSVVDMLYSKVEALETVAIRMKSNGQDHHYAIVEFDTNGKYLQVLTRSPDRGALHSCCMMLDALAKMVIRLGGDLKIA